MTPLGRIYAFATVTRFITVLLGILSYIYTGSYDTSTEIVLSSNPALHYFNFLNIFARWDAIYFVHIAKHGYVYEQETAFFPLLSYLTRYLSQTVFLPLQSILGEQYTIVFIGALISNVSFVLAAGYLYKLTRSIYPTNTKLATYSSIAFCLSPPSMFMSAFYTESIFAFLSFLGMYHVSKQRFLLGSIIWGIASLARSNAIIYIGFFIYDIIIKRIRYHSIKTLIIGFLQVMIYSSITLSGFAVFQFLIYRQYCTDDILEQRPWCLQLVPLAYSFVQKEYWGNGFLAYFQVKQIPNFLLAAPIIGLSIAGLWQFIAKDWTRWITLGVINDASVDDTSYTSNQASVYMYLWTFLLFYATTCMHVQVILRFFTSLPPLYWYIGQLWYQGFQANRSSRDHWIAHSILSYFVLYGLVGIILFSAFLPPA
ncbi:GPI mannosyltransferase 2 [Halteromyces radiatus]|uniref:GPI mannosyltransferase 2 n=1 Tax=Halteromyces radiatus TaxID=101107 RepID=UPI0022207260|nr:GPI mannosyltransferase 2 [Halteromyces radiatus]KAI8077838.1 GPI mannosyltransferase 2 [Halteromyces radiatus]